MSVSNVSPVTATDVRTWFKALESADTPRQLVEEHFDENIEWWSSTPGDGPLGRTNPISGRVVGVKAWLDRTVIPLEAPFVNPIKYTIVDVVLQPSRPNDDPAERHLTKAMVEMRSNGVLKKDGSAWENYNCLIVHINNDTKRIVQGRMYSDSAALNIAFEK